MTASFDQAAQTYDHDFTHTTLARYLRDVSRANLMQHLQPGDTVLEIGCGTGEDAVWLARQGIRVLATDVSPVMLEKTQEKAAQAELTDYIETRLLDLNAWPDWRPDQLLHGVFSNFGAVNCTSDFSGLAAHLDTWLRPGGYVNLVVMSPFCLWEMLWHGLHLNFQTAFRRRKRHTVAQLPDGSTLDVYYPSIQEMTRAFMPHFERVNRSGLGVFLPPSDIFGVIEKRPHLMNLLVRLEKRLAQWYPFYTWADHYQIEFLKR